ncbi:MAG TPA: hypothetical protein VHE35_18780 [Kofleriaceae bacterium]|nr:hypothetical protein [Kofleriaceae bacterium]
MTAEAVIGRVVKEGLEPHPTFIHGVAQTIAKPLWLHVLESVAIFLLDFAALVGVAALVVRVVELVRHRPASLAGRLDAGVGVLTLALVAGAAAVAVALPSPEPVQGLLHGALAAVAAHQIVRVWAGKAGLAARVGVTVCAAPILLYGGASLLAHTIWSEDQLLGGEVKYELARWARGALVLAAFAAPLCLSPRPFTRHATRIFPFLVAVVVATLGATLLRYDYFETVKAANRVFGLELRTDELQEVVALYLLAFAAVLWTVTACLIADAPARRRIGLGLTLLVMLGQSFAWPLAFVAGAVGLTMLADGALAVGAQERHEYVPATPPIDDEAWQGYVGQVVSGLRRGSDGVPVSAVSVRGEGQSSSTTIVTERHGVPVRVRVERVARAVVVLDLVCGREVEVGRAATWSVLARAGAPAARGSHPEPPAAGSPFRTDDVVFDERFRARGDRASLMQLFDDDLRARAAASLGGWLAYWEGVGLRHRVFPGVGAPLDQPLPLSDLAVRRSAPPAAADRLVAIIELCSELAARGLPLVDEPQALAADAD